MKGSSILFGKSLKKDANPSFIPLKRFFISFTGIKATSLIVPPNFCNIFLESSAHIFLISFPVFLYTSIAPLATFHADRAKGPPFSPISLTHEDTPSFTLFITFRAVFIGTIEILNIVPKSFLNIPLLGSAHKSFISLPVSFSIFHWLSTIFPRDLIRGPLSSVNDLKASVPLSISLTTA